MKYIIAIIIILTTFGSNAQECITIPIPDLVYPSDTSTIKSCAKTLELSQISFKDNSFTQQLSNKIDSIFRINENLTYILSFKSVDPTQISLSFFNWDFWLYVDTNYSNIHFVGTMLLNHSNSLRKILIVGTQDNNILKFISQNFSFCKSSIIYQREIITIPENSFIIEPDYVHGFQLYIPINK